MRATFWTTPLTRNKREAGLSLYSVRCLDSGAVYLKSPDGSAQVVTAKTARGNGAILSRKMAHKWRDPSRSDEFSTFRVTCLRSALTHYLMEWFDGHCEGVHAPPRPECRPNANNIVRPH